MLQRSLLFFAFLLILLTPLSVAAASFAEPSVSPDGNEIAFVSGGDIWSVPSRGGDARLLVAHPANESHPVFSPDGSALAFVSDRTGNGDVYVLDLKSGSTTRLTWDDGPEVVDGWSADGQWVYFDSGSQDVGGGLDVFRVRATGGTPMRVTNEAYTTEFFAAPSPDGKRVAFSARGLGASQWWRRGHSHIDESELWLLEDAGASKPEYRQLTPRGSKHLWPMWSAQGDRVFFVSDEGGQENLWSIAAAGGQAYQRTRFLSGRILWPSIARNGSLIAFERDFRIFTYDLSTGDVKEVPVALRGSASTTPIEHRTFSSNIEDLALSADRKKVAFIVHGEVFAASAADGGAAVRVATTPAEEVNLRWAPDSHRLVYSSARDGSLQLYLYDFATQKEQRLTTSSADDFQPQFSPDGKSIAFLRDGKELRLVDPATKKESLIASAPIDLPPPLYGTRSFTWSPDSRQLAFLEFGPKLFRNVFVVTPGETAAPRQVSFTGNVNSDTVSWSSDGKFLTFDSGQRSEVGQVARVDLIPRTPLLREEQFRELFKEESPPSVPSKETKTPRKDAKEGDTATVPATKISRPQHVEINFDDIRRRLTFLPVGIDVQSQVISPDGKQLLLTATVAGQQNLYLYSLDELAKDPPVAKQITSTAGDKTSMQWSSDSKEIWYLDDGQIMHVGVDGSAPKSLGVSAEMDVDFDREKLVMFRQAWSWEGKDFHDPTMNGVDWQALGARTRAQVEAARTPEEVRRILSLMVGELNASHLGVRNGATPQRTTGRTGLVFDRAEYESNGRFVISRIIPLSPAAVTGKIKPGDVLISIDGQKLDARSNLDALLEYKIGKEVRLTVAASPGAATREVVIQPVNFATYKELLYEDWVESNREYVRRVSNGRLGYVHMIDMSSEALNSLLKDLDAENQTREGVVIDIRNNNGGFVNAYALDVFTRQHYLNMTFRGLPTAPARTVLGQRALERPTILVTNQHSLSDAEDFSEGYRKMKLGKIVGEPTAGWIIYTGNYRLIDRTIFRIPFITITTAEGENMEMHPRPVDFTVIRPIGETAAGRDSQLDRAVEELLKTLK